MIASNEINTKIMKVLQTITDYVEQQQLVDWLELGSLKSLQL